MRMRPVGCFVLAMIASLASYHRALPDKNLVTIAIITVPASPKMEAEFYNLNEKWSYLPGSLVDFVGMGAGMPVMVPFDSDREKLLYMLAKVDGVLIPSPYALLKKDSKNWSSYMDTVKAVVKWTKEHNAKGVFFPLLALGNGMDALLASEADHLDAVSCQPQLKRELRKLKSLPDLDSSPFWSRVGASLHKQLFDRASLYFEENCGVLSANFASNPGLASGYSLLATSVSGSGKEYASVVEHKTLPITGIQFHPEKHIYERGDLYSFIDRSEEAIQLSQQIVAAFLARVRKSGTPKEFKKIPFQVKQYFSLFRPAEMPLTEEFERIYTFQRYHNID